MLSSEILELVRAGYTKEEINAMDQVQDQKPESPTDPDPEPEQEVKPDQTNEPDKKKDVSTGSDNEYEQILKDKVKALESEIQDLKRKNIENPEPSQEKPYDALAAAKEFFGVSE